MFTTLKAMCFYECSVKLCDKNNTTLICSTYLITINDYDIYRKNKRQHTHWQTYNK